MNTEQEEDMIEEVSIPEVILNKLYDCCGSEQSGTRGFVLFYVNEDGKPSLVKKSENLCVEMALHKLVELYLTAEK